MNKAGKLIQFKVESLGLAFFFVCLLWCWLSSLLKGKKSTLVIAIDIKVRDQKIIGEMYSSLKISKY